MMIRDQRAAGIKSAVERAMVVEHKVRIVPLAVEFK